MFEKYDNQSPNYVPNNMFKIPKVVQLGVEDNNYDPIRDEHNQIIGYEWNYGDTGSIPISTNIDIRVYPNDIICNDRIEYNEEGEPIQGVPDKIFTRAEKGTRFYNTVEVKSWCCNAIIERNTYIVLEEEPKDFKYSFYNYFEKINGEYVRLRKIMPWQPYRYYREATTYIWVPDDSIIFFSDGVTPVKLTPDMAGKNLNVEITNFRHENLDKFNMTYHICKPSAEDIPLGVKYKYIVPDDEEGEKTIEIIGTKEAKADDIAEYVVQDINETPYDIYKYIYKKYKVKTDTQTKLSNWELIETVETGYSWTYSINEELSKKLFPGIWYLNAYVEGNGSKSKLLTYQLHVK